MKYKNVCDFCGRDVLSDELEFSSVCDKCGGKKSNKNFNLFKFIAKTKNFSTRSYAYINIINSLLILLTFKKAYDIPIHSVFIVLFVISLVLVVGVLDYKFILKHEIEHVNKRNDMKQDLKEIKKTLQELKKI